MGDLVQAYNYNMLQHDFGPGKKRKLEWKWRGPYRIIKKLGEATFEIEWADMVPLAQRQHRVLRAHARNLSPAVWEPERIFRLNYPAATEQACTGRSGAPRVGASCAASTFTGRSGATRVGSSCTACATSTSTGRSGATRVGSTWTTSPNPTGCSGATRCGAAAACTARTRTRASARATRC